MSKVLRQRLVGEYVRRYKHMKDCLLLDYRGLSAEDAQDLRVEMTRHGGRVHVVKNSCFRVALRERGVRGADAYLRGPVAVLEGQDIATLSRELTTWRGRRKVMWVRAGILDGKAIGPREAERLAHLPPRPVAIAMLAGTLNGALVGFARVLRGAVQGLAFALKDYTQKA